METEFTSEANASLQGISFLLNITVLCSGELIINGYYESAIDGTNWLCFSCTLDRDEDAFGGTYSDKITNR